MSKSKIEWTGSTWNPIRARNRETGAVGTVCRKISPGCARCYAERHNGRDLPAGSSGLPYTAAGVAGAEIFLDPKILAAPLRRKKPETYFVCSMTDLFMEEHGFEMIAALFGVMAATPQHTYQVLTKRPERAAEFFSWLLSFESAPPGQPATGTGWCRPLAACVAALKLCEAALPRDLTFDGEAPWPLPNVWLGVSAEDQERADQRIPILLDIPAAVHFVSAEPLLGSIDFRNVRSYGIGVGFDALRGFNERQIRLGWVIVGGESGPGARSCCIEDVRSIRRQCQEAEVPLFVKQLGTHSISELGRGVQYQHKGGNPAEWPEDLRVRELPARKGA